MNEVRIIGNTQGNRVLPCVMPNYIDEWLPLIADNYHVESEMRKNMQITTKSGMINDKIFIRCSIVPIGNWAITTPHFYTTFI